MLFFDVEIQLCTMAEILRLFILLYFLFFTIYLFFVNVYFLQDCKLDIMFYAFSSGFVLRNRLFVCLREAMIGGKRLICARTF